MSRNAGYYFVAWKGRRDGPYTLEQLAELLQKGALSLLHRVETPEGSVPLRQLLLASDPVRWAGLAVPAGQAAAPEPGAEAAPAEPARPLPSSERGPAPWSNASPFRRVDREPENLQKIYTVCGLSFLVPPLALWGWKTAEELDRAGHPDLGERLKWLNLIFGLGGVLFWIVLCFVL